MSIRGILQSTARYFVLIKAATDIVNKAKEIGMKDIKTLVDAGRSITEVYLESCPPDKKVGKRREANKSDIQVVIGKGKVKVIATSELAKEYKTTVSQVILDAQRQGYTVLGWEQYQKLLDEIVSLIGEDKESRPGTIVGVPVTTVDSPQQVKILPKSPPF